MPWIGYIHKMSLVDIFVLLDDVQFKKNEYQNRNLIKSANGKQWLTVPVIHKFPQNINEVRINNCVNWMDKHLKTIKQNYSKSKYFDEVMPIVTDIYSKVWDNLCELNSYIIIKLKSALGIKCDIIKSSSLGVTSTKTVRLIEILKKLNADIYISGKGALEYLELEKFEENGIKIEFQNFNHPIYPQLYGEFIKNLSIIDMLMNIGIKKSIEMIKNC